MFILLIAAIVSLVTTIAFVGYRFVSEKPKRIERKHREAIDTEFSWAARQVVYAFERLPEAHRPSYNLMAAMRALEAKYGRDKVHGHFIEVGLYSRSNKFSWRCRCVWDSSQWKRVGDKCKHYPEYKDILDSIGEIDWALKKQEAAFKEREYQTVMAGLESDLRSVGDITDALRAERDLINSVTKEILP